MPSPFGDDDPEDAYDVDDSAPARAELAGRVLVAIVAEQAAEGTTPRVVARIAVACRIVATLLDDVGEGLG